VQVTRKDQDDGTMGKREGAGMGEPSPYL